MALNAQPWADVWVDGERVGETPIGNVAVPIGPHEVVFRHPQLGEQVVSYDRYRGSTHTCKRRYEEEMIMRITSTAVTCLVILLLTAARLHAQDTLATARDLYASAEDDNALKLLERLSATSGEEQQSIDLYRSLCLLAVGRNQDAERSIETIIARDPLYQTQRRAFPPDAQRIQRRQEVVCFRQSCSSSMPKRKVRSSGKSSRRQLSDSRGLSRR